MKMDVLVNEELWEMLRKLDRIMIKLETAVYSM